MKGDSIFAENSEELEDCHFSWTNNKLRSKTMMKYRKQQ